MANYDAGHFFLTVMAPIDRDGWIELDGQRRSVLDHVRGILTTLPTAQQDTPSTESGLNSPFAAVPGTHFAHIFVIDELRFNGRRPSNPIIDLILNTHLTEAQKVDRLPHAYLVLSLDFDALDGSDAALKAYTDGLWREMRDTLVLIFGHCIGFEKVTGEDSFFDYMRAAQVTTSLPYNDYWTQEPPDRSPLKWMIAVSLVIIMLGLAGWMVPLWSLELGNVATTLLLLIIANIAIIAWFGLTPFPKAPDSDINSVLKALYIQQMFTGFAVENLGKSDTDLQSAFDAFCVAHQPAVISGPRQTPGVLHSTWKKP